MVLVKAARPGRLTPARRVTATLERRHGDAIREIFQIDPAGSPPRKRSRSSASGQLTKSEIEALRQGKREVDDYARKPLTGWAAKPVEAVAI